MTFVSKLIFLFALILSLMLGCQCQSGIKKENSSAHRGFAQSPGSQAITSIESLENYLKENGAQLTKDKMVSQTNETIEAPLLFGPHSIFGVIEDSSCKEFFNIYELFNLSKIEEWELDNKPVDAQVAQRIQNIFDDKDNCDFKFIAMMRDQESQAHVLKYLEQIKNWSHQTEESPLKKSSQEIINALGEVTCRASTMETADIDKLSLDTQLFVHFFRGMAYEFQPILGQSMPCQLSL